MAFQPLFIRGWKQLSAYLYFGRCGFGLYQMKIHIKKNAGAFTMTVMHLRYGTFRGEMLLALLLDDHNREFIQEIQRYEHKHEREGVATGSDDCCKYQQTYNGMTPIFAQE